MKELDSLIGYLIGRNMHILIVICFQQNIFDANYSFKCNPNTSKRQ